MHAFGADYYSQGSSRFSTLNNWNSLSGGGGSQPLFADLLGGTNNFIIQNGDIITLDTNVNIGNLTLNSSSLVFGNNTLARSLVVNSVFTVSASSNVSNSVFNALHTLELKGNLVNNGSIDLYNSNSQATHMLISGTVAHTGNAFDVKNLEINTGSFAAGAALNIFGNVILETSTTLNGGSFSHNVYGSWTENGNALMVSTGTIIFKSTSIQQITNAATFNNIEVNGGGILSITGNIIVNGNINVSNNTSIITANSHYVYGNVNVSTGSKIKSTNGTFYFYSSSPQSIALSPTSELYRIYFQYGGPASPKTIVGDLVAKNYMIIYDQASVGGTGNYTLSNGIRVDGLCTFSGQLTLKGGSISDQNNDDLTLGTAEIIIQGSVSVYTNDILRVSENITVETGYLVLSVGSQLIQSGSSKNLTLKPNTDLYIRGANNFPTGFATIDFQSGTDVRYDGALDQTIKGNIDYQNVYISRAYNKTVDGELTVQGNMVVYTSVVLNLGAYQHSFAGNFTNAGSVLSSGTVTMMAAGKHQTINGAGSTVVNNIIFTNVSPSAIYIKNIDHNITVNGDFTISNGSTNTANLLILDIDANTLINDGGNTFTLGENVRLSTSGANSFSTSLASFQLANLHANSIVRYDGTAQEIAEADYGYLELYGNGVKTMTDDISIYSNVTTVGGTPILTDNGNTINVYGAWDLNVNNTNTLTGIVRFRGTNQTIRASGFHHLSIEGSGVKTLTNNITIRGNLSIANAAKLDANNENITIYGDWNQQTNSLYTQTIGHTYLLGAQNDVQLTSNDNSYFGHLHIDKSSGNKTVIANSDIHIKGNFYMVANNVVFNLNANDIYTEDNWYYYAGASFQHNNGKVYFNGPTDQYIYNYQVLSVKDIEFSGSGQKFLYTSNVDVDGDVTIQSVTLNTGANNIDMYVAGDWINKGTFSSDRPVYFDGADQSISASTFHDVHFDGTGTKTLAGNINLDGGLYIENGSTLDVSASNYDITVEEIWSNIGTGIFNARNATVNFVGGSSYLHTGGASASKDFYQVIINKTANQRLYLMGDLRVEDNFELNNGYFRTSTFDMSIGGDFLNNSGLLEHNSADSKLTLNATSGTKIFRPGDDYFRNVEINSTGSYEFDGDIRFYDNYDFVITNGNVDINGNKISLGQFSEIDLMSGTLDIPAGSFIAFNRESILYNHGGNLNITGSQSNVVIFASNQTTASRYFKIIQTAGTISADNYRFEKIGGNGVEIQGGTIDAIHNFSNGAFINGGGTSYFTLTGLNFGSGITIDNVSFASGPTYNVTRLSGTGAVNFTNCTGAKVGQAYENDNGVPGTLINWIFNGDFYWDGGAGTTAWNDASNWLSNSLPTSISNVVLDHTYVPGSYTVNISGTAAHVANLEITGSPAVTLNLNGADLTVDNNIAVTLGNTLGILTATDDLTVSGNFNFGGVLNASNGRTILNATSGTLTIDCGSAFHDLEINAPGATYVLAKALDINGDITLVDGSLDVSSSNYTVSVSGNWTKTNGDFVKRFGRVTLDGIGGTNQQISGGSFYDLTLSNGNSLGTATKTANSNISIEDDIQIMSNTVFNADANIVFVGDDWLNNAGTAGFVQSGVGSVIFNGGSQLIGDYTSTTTNFNTVYFQGTGNKDIRASMNVAKDLVIANGISSVIVRDGVIVNGTGSANTLTQSGSTLQIRGANNFPTGFEQINLSAGNVYYYANFDQMIYPTTYNNLLLLRIDAGQSQTKTISSDLIINGGLTINDADTKLDVDGHTITITGNLSKATGAPSIDWGTGTYIWNNPSNVVIDRDITNFHNIIFNASGQKYLGGNVDITGDVTIHNGAYLSNYYSNLVYTMNATGSGQTFTLAANSRYYAYDQSSSSKAFPMGYANYYLDNNSSVYIRATSVASGSQTIFTTPTYGNLFIFDNISRAVTLDGDLDVEGNLIMSYNTPTLNDGGFDMDVSGATVDFRLYSPSISSTLTLSGADQNIYDNGATVLLELNNVVFSGTGTKTIMDNALIGGSLVVENNVSLKSTRLIEFNGSAWTNDGDVEFTAGEVHFNATTAQTIKPGANHTFYSVKFGNTGTKTISTNGLDVNGNFEIVSGTVDFSSLAHRIASATVINNGTWLATSADIYFDRDNGNQTICALHANDIYLTTSGTRYKTLTGAWEFNNIDVASNVYFRSGAAIPGNNITVHGNWTNNGIYQAYGNTVSFEADNTTTRSIKTNSSDFYNLQFNQTLSNACTYQATSDIEIDENLVIGNGATLLANGNVFTLGDNTNVETHVVQVGGKLDIGANSTLKINAYNGDAQLDIYGELSLVGNVSSIATLTRAYGNYRLDVDIIGKLSARYYHMEYLADAGLNLSATAVIDAVNNLSDGTFSNLNTSGTAQKLYINFKNNTSTLAPLANVTFNYSSTPVVGRHYNVKKNSSSTGDVTFATSSSGVIAGTTYEDDVDDMVHWPSVSQVQWVGSVSNDWFTPGNWSPAIVPTSLIDAIIPSATNYPIVDGNNANCKNLTLSNGILSLDGGYDISIAEDILIGTNNYSAILTVASFTCEIVVGGDWNINAYSVFTHGNGSVRFIKSGGTVSITPRTSRFNDVVLNGNSTFNFVGSKLYIDGNLTLSNGEFYPKTNNYIFESKGDIINSGGSMSSVVGGTLLLSGANQNLSNINVYRMEVKGSGIKSISGTNTIRNKLTVVSNLTSTGGGTIEMQGDVEILSGAVFNDGNATHTFTGANWKGDGSYQGNGTVTFGGGSHHYIYNSSFANMMFDGTGRIYLYGNVNLTGDLYINQSINQFYAYDKLINNTTGSGTFTIEQSEYFHVKGTNNFPSNFSTYSIHASSYVYYSGAANQTIASHSYGNLLLSNANTKSLAGDIVVKGYLDFSTATLDVTTNNYTIEVQQDWRNSTTGSFICRQGEVIFTGTISNQYIRTNLTGINDFYKVKLDKSQGYLRAYDNPIRILSDLRIFNGIFHANNQTIEIGGDMNAIGGTFYANGTYILNKASGTAIVQTNGSTLLNLTINSSSNASFVVQDALSINGNLDIQKGTFDGNGKIVNAGDNGDIITVSGTYKVGAGGQLNLGSNVSLNVESGGVFELIGTVSSRAAVNHRTTGRYNFTVEGTIKASNYEFKYMTAAGIYIKSNATIDAVANFSDGTFDYGTAGGTLLRIENNQSLVGANSIKNVTFPTNPNYGASNVMKSNSTTGSIEFFNAQGNFSGEIYDNDPSDLISWTGDVILTWDGSTSTNWFTASNWTPSSGPEIVPTGNEDVIIASAINQPVINNSGALTKNLDIKTGAVLSLSTSSGTAADLSIHGDFEIMGTLIINTDDIIEVDGYWNRVGSFTCGQGKVVIKNTQGGSFIKNDAVPFYNLVIEGNATVDVKSNTVVGNDLIIQNGTLDINSSSYYMKVKGDFINNSVYTHNDSKVILAASAAGSNQIDLGSSTLKKLEINAHANAIYTIVNNDLEVTNRLDILNGQLDLGTQDLLIGSGTTSDLIAINGKLTINAGTAMKMSSNSYINVNSGGVLAIISNDASNPAMVTSQSTTRYIFNINSGGEISAKNYHVSYTNVYGLRLKSGALINATNNLSEGTFSNGYSSGYYLWLDNNFISYTATNIVFNVGAKYNVRRTIGTGDITLEDASGVKGGHLYEYDDNNASTGRVRWTYTNTNLVWVGGVSSDWDNVNNWNGGLPNVNTIVTIPDAGSNYDPIVSASHIEVKSLTVATGGILEIKSARNLTIDGDMNNVGILKVATNSISKISVKGNWSNSGTFNNGNASTVEFNAVSGLKTIDPGTSPFYNMIVNSSSNATFQSGNTIAVDNDLTVSQGSLELSSSNHNLSVGGDIVNNGTLNCSGSMLILNGIGNQDISSITGAEVTSLKLSGTGIKSLSADLRVAGKLEIGANTTLNAGSHTVEVSGDFDNFGTYSYATSTLVLNGTSLQNVKSTTSLSLYNLTVNNTSSSFPQVILDRDVTIKAGGVLNLNDGIVQTSSSDLLTLESGATLTGGNSIDSYIDGPMAKIGNQNFVFPVGDGTIFARIAISGLSSSATFKAQYYDQAYNDINNFDDLDHVSDIEYWDLERVSGSATPSVTVYYENGVRSTVNDIDDIVVGHYEGGLWKNMGAATAGTELVGSVMSTVGFTSYSPISIGFKSVEGGLPIELLSFEAKKEESDVRIDWTTLTEKDNDYFTIERSVDGTVFEAIAVVEGQGTSLTRNDYTYLDRDAVSGTLYYRLKQTDYDGSFTYSSMVSVYIKMDGVQVNIYPNPSNGSNLNMDLSGFDNEMKFIQIINTSGQTVFATETIEDYLHLSPAQLNLAKGFYMVVVTGTTAKAVQKLTIN